MISEDLRPGPEAQVGLASGRAERGCGKGALDKNNYVKTQRHWICKYFFGALSVQYMCLETEKNSRVLSRARLLGDKLQR